MNEVHGPKDADIEKVLNGSQELRPFERSLLSAMKELLWAGGSIILALLVAALIMIATEYDPVFAYTVLIQGAFRNPDQVLWYATPLLLTGLSVALAFKAGLFNIGAEGQLYMGSMVATIIGVYVLLPSFIHPLVCLAAAAIAGAAWAFIPGILKAYRGAHEVVTTMMMTYIAILFTEWLVTFPLKEPGTPYPQTSPIQPTAILPSLLGSPFLHAGFLIAIISALVVWFFLNYTVRGYEVRAVGKNLEAAETAGINSKYMMVLALTLSGALAGLAGAGEILGYYHRFINGWSPGLGFDGITVAVLGLNNPFGVILAALFFGFLKAGAVVMDAVAGVPREMVVIIQGLVVLFVAAPKIIQWLASKGNEYALWIIEEPKKALPIFLTAVIAVVGSVIGLFIGFAYLQADVIFMAQMVTLGLLALFAFVGILMRKTWGLLVACLTSIGWIILAALILVYQVNTLTIPLLVLGVVGLILVLPAYYLIVRKAVVIGGVF
ncbi:MAG: ABC transporter permease [Promethearchaeota archaeon]